MATRKPSFIIPPNEKKRLNKLYQYQILNTHSEQEFDDIAQLAANIFDCPTAFISFVDTDTVFYKTNLNNEGKKLIPRGQSFCSLTILNDEVTMIEDVSQFEDLTENPYVHKPGDIRFYAGAPLTTSEGFKLGSICVIDNKPRAATTKDLKILVSLAKLVVDKLESRMAYKKTISIQTEYMNRSVHDLKNYIGNVSLATEMLLEIKLEEKFKNLPKLINRNVQRLSERINQILNLSKIESSAYHLNMELCNVSEILDEVIDNYYTVSYSKNQTIKKEFASGIIITADCKALFEIFENLLSNAIKYSFPESEIKITSKEKREGVILGFHDKGQGLTNQEIEKIFIRYATISSTPTGKESSNGIGLAITKILVELHNGKIWAESKGKNKGSSFFIYFPIINLN